MATKRTQSGHRTPHPQKIQRPQRPPTPKTPDFDAPALPAGLVAMLEDTNNGNGQSLVEPVGISRSTSSQPSSHVSHTHTAPHVSSHMHTAPHVSSHMHTALPTSVPAHTLAPTMTQSHVAAQATSQVLTLPPSQSLLQVTSQQQQQQTAQQTVQQQSPVHSQQTVQQQSPAHSQQTVQQSSLVRSQQAGTSTSMSAASVGQLPAGYRATPGIARLSPAPNYQVDCSMVAGVVRWQDGRFKSTRGDVVTLNVGALQAVGHSFDLYECLKFFKAAAPAVRITLGTNQTIDLRLGSHSTLSQAVDSYLTNFLFSVHLIHDTIQIN